MIRRGDLDGRPPGMGAALFPVVSEMNGQHAPPTGDPDGRPIGINLRKDRQENKTPEVID
jgi:hypothetical protein